MTTQDRAKQAIPLLQAIVEGKTLQYTNGCSDSEWEDEVTPPIGDIASRPEHYRIKPQPREWWEIRPPDITGPGIAGVWQFTSKEEAEKYIAHRQHAPEIVHVIEAP